MTTLTWPGGSVARFDVTGADRLDASGTAMFGIVNLAAHSHLLNTGSLNFIYAEQLDGDPTASITNNGSIMTANGNVSVPIDGNGTLGFGGYHDSVGTSVISASVSRGQTVQLDPHSFGMNLELADARDFHGMLKIMPNSLPGGDISVTVDGVKATSFSVQGAQLTLLNGNQAVDTLRVNNVAAAPITASFGAENTTLTFHTSPAHAIS